MTGESITARPRDQRWQVAVKFKADDGRWKNVEGIGGYYYSYEVPGILRSLLDAFPGSYLTHDTADEWGHRLPLPLDNHD